MGLGSWSGAHPFQVAALVLLVVGTLGTWWAAPLIFVAFLALAALAWIPWLGSRVLGLLNWSALPAVGGFVGIKASGVLVTGAVAVMIVGTTVGPRAPVSTTTGSVAAATASRVEGAARALLQLLQLHRELLERSRLCDGMFGHDLQQVGRHLRVVLAARRKPQSTPGTVAVGFRVRRTYHDHAPHRHHAHCLDPRHPERDHHYRDVPVSVFEAHAEFLQWYARGEDMNCFGLFPLFP